MLTGAREEDVKATLPQRRFLLLRFVVGFSLMMGLFYAIAGTERFERQLFEPYLRESALVSAALLAALGQESAAAFSMFVTSPRYTLEIDRGCDAIEPTALFVALVLAFPAPFLRKLAAVAVGIPLLGVLNLVRIVSLFLVGAYYPGVFHVMHVDVWQAVFIAVAIAGWLIWLTWATAPRAPQHAAT